MNEELKCKRCGATEGMFFKDHFGNCWYERAINAEARTEKLLQIISEASFLVSNRAETLLKYNRKETAKPWLQCSYKMIEVLY